MIISVVLIISALFTLLAAVGLLTMPDIYTKMHTVSKAGAFGGSLILLSAAAVFGTGQIFIILANIIFFYFTTPVAAQMIAKAAILRKTHTWEKTKKDEIDF